MWTNKALSWEEGVIMYYLDGRKVCEVTLERLDLEYGHRGCVYQLEDRPLHFLFPDKIKRKLFLPAIIIEDDFDVLKLKCLLKAKEMGWDIKEIGV